MINLQQDSIEKLITAINECGLNKYTEKLIEASRECVRIVVTEDIESLEVGASRIGGAPDLESEEQWPRYGYGERKDAFSVFYFQVNLSHLPFIIAPKIPDHGIISVYSTSQNQLEDDGTVLYLRDIAKVTNQRLPKLIEFGDEDLDEEFHIPACYRSARKIEFERHVSLPGYMSLPDFIDEEDIDAYLEIADCIPKYLDGEEIGYMFAHSLEGTPEENDTSWVSLFNLHSNSTYFSFGDCGNCDISVKRGKVNNGDFSESQFSYCDI